MRKIIDNLYLGDMHSAPEDSDLIISCAEEIFQDKCKGINELKHWLDEKHVYYSFEDYPDTLDKEMVLDAVKQIEENIKTKKIYVHCVWGVNRSASIVFIYLVRNGYVKADNYAAAHREFRMIYPDCSPNPGWKKFLEGEFNFTKTFKGISKWKRIRRIEHIKSLFNLSNRGVTRLEDILYNRFKNGEINKNKFYWLRSKGLEYLLNINENEEWIITFGGKEFVIT